MKKVKSVQRYYDKYQEEIIKMVRWFQHKYGTQDSYDDMLSIANLAFAKAIVAHDPKKGKFGPRLRTVIFQDLMDLTRKRLRERVRRVKLEHGGVYIQNTPSPRSLEEFLSELSENARRVVKMALDTPGEIIQSFGLEPRPAKVRIGIRKILYDCWWTKREIKNTFEEIRRVLRGG